MTQPTKRGTYAKTAARRREILEAAIEVFATNGFRHGSLREVAERVSMSQAGLLHHFTTKNELLAQVLALRDERSTRMINLEANPGIDTIRGFVRLTEYNASMPGLVELHCVLSAEATSVDHPAHAYFVERYEWVVGQMTGAFAEMHADGQLALGVTPESAGRSLIAMSDGLQVQWLLNRESLDMAHEMRHFLRALITVEL